jgi:hypothetical protein
MGRGEPLHIERVKLRPVPAADLPMHGLVAASSPRARHKPNHRTDQQLLSTIRRRTHSLLQQRHTHTVSAATLSAVTDSTFSVKDLSLQHRLRDTIELRAQVVVSHSVRWHEQGLASEERLLLASSLHIAEHSMGNAATIVESAQRKWIELAGSEARGEMR